MFGGSSFMRGDKLVTEYVPMSVAVVTALLGVVAYYVQKKADRKSELLNLRREAYQNFIQAFQLNIEFSTRETLANYHVYLMRLFAIANDDVIRTAGALNRYLEKHRNRKSA
jgi:hypothetical protein